MATGQHAGLSASRGAAWVVLAAVLWSSGGLFIKWAPLPGLAVAGGRAAVTALFYLAVLRPDLRRASLTTALTYALMILSFVTATKLTTAASAIFLQYTGTAWVLVAGPRLLGEPLRRVDGVAAAAALLGMGLCLLDGSQAGADSAQRWQGDVLGAISGVFFAGTVIAMRRDARPGAPYDAQASTTLGNLLAAALALPLSAEALGGALQPAAVGALLYLGVVQMGLAYLAFLKGLRVVPAATASLLALAEPALSPLWVLLGTGERPGAWTLAGGAVVLSALAGRAWWAARHPAATPAAR